MNAPLRLQRAECALDGALAPSHRFGERRGGPRLAPAEQSHERRVETLRRRIELLGGQPAVSPGLGGAFAKAMQGSANLLGEKAAIASLEELEDRELDEYRKDLGELDEDTRAFIEAELLPAQKQSHAKLSSLQRLMS